MELPEVASAWPRLLVLLGLWGTCASFHVLQGGFFN